MSLKSNAIVLLSGGIDSATCLAIAKTQGFTVWALTFYYGQRHSIEIESAKRLGRYFKVKEHLILNIDSRLFQGVSALTGEIDVPKARSKEGIKRGIPITYVPARNTIFLAHALAWAEVIPATDIFIGINAVDFSGYPDCSPEYINLFQQLAKIGTRAGVEKNVEIKIRAPLCTFSKAEIIQKAIELNVDLSLTHSCYDPSPEGLACGLCDSCILRQKGFKEAGVEDTILYQTKNYRRKYVRL
jgi:7-cyano-7-deazaguanine synthase